MSEITLDRLVYLRKAGEIKAVLPLSFEKRNDGFEFYFVEDLNNKKVLSYIKFFDNGKFDYEKDLLEFKDDIYSLTPFVFNKKDCIIYVKRDEKGHENLIFSSINENGNYKNLSEVSIKKIDRLISLYDKKYFRDPLVVDYNGGFYLYVSTKKAGTPIILRYFTNDFVNFKLNQRIYGRKSFGDEMRFFSLALPMSEGYASASLVENGEYKPVIFKYDASRSNIELSKSDFIPVDESDDVKYFNITYRLGKYWGIAGFLVNGERHLSTIRELTFEDDVLYQKPLSNILSSLNKVLHTTVILKNKLSFDVTSVTSFNGFMIPMNKAIHYNLILKNNKNMINFMIAGVSREVEVTRNNKTVKKFTIKNTSESLNIKVFIINKIIEVYFGNGEQVYTTYLDNNGVSTVEILSDDEVTIVSSK